MIGITVIIPCYNVEPYIDRCLASVVNQTYCDFEIILLNDGSMDKTAEKCMEWKRRCPKIIFVSKNNEGLGATRNLGITMANKEYITFLDADDWWDIDYLKEMAFGIQDGLNDVVMCDFNFVYEYGDKREYILSALRFPKGKINKDNEPHFLSRARTYACGKLYRRSLFIDNNVKEPPHAYEDVATTPYVMAKAKSVFHIEKPMYFYVKNRQDSIINKFPSLPDLLLALNNIADLFIRDDIFDRFYSQLRQIFWSELCFLCRVIDGKFSAEETAERQRLKIRGEQLVYGIFPELRKLSECKYLILGSLALSDAVKHIILDSGQVISDENYECADVVVTENDVDELKYQGKKIIKANIDNYFSDDYERLTWDISDDIFTAMLDNNSCFVSRACDYEK